MRRVLLGSIAASSVLVLAACGSSSPSSSAPPSMTPTTSSASAALKVASTSLGRVVVDGQGMTVYVYDLDHQGTQVSACTGGCAAAWPAVLVTGTPKLAGVTGDVGTIPTAGGKKQVTLNGWPLYTYSGDSAPGQVGGQGSGGTWWVISPSGTKVTSTADPSSSSSGAASGW